jgi:hypothetical protein
MSSIDSFFKTSSYDQVASIDIQYLEVYLINSFLVKIKPQVLYQVIIQLLLVHQSSLIDLT